MDKKTMLVVGMLFVSLVPFCAAAQGNGGQGGSGIWGGASGGFADKFDAAKQAWQEMKGKINDSSGEVRERVRERAQNYLLAAADRIINNAENVQNRVENTAALGDDQKDDIISALEGFMDYFESVKPGIEGAETIEELRATSQEMRGEWEQFRAEVRVIAGNIWAARVDRAIARAENASVKVQERLRLRANATNASAIELDLGDYDALVGDAQDLNDQAKELFSEITDLTSAQEKAPEGRQLIKSASDKLKEARQVLKDIIRGLKGLRTQ